MKRAGTQDDEPHNIGALCFVFVEVGNQSDVIHSRSYVFWTVTAQKYKTLLSQQLIHNYCPF